MIRTVVNARRPARRAVCLGLERLDDRTTPASVSWDGGGEDFNWNNPVNWDTNSLPGANDVAIIGPAYSGITVTHAAGTTSLDRLFCQGSLVVTGGTFSVASYSNVYRHFTLAGATLTGAGSF